jgi:hypothetical protein
VVVLKNTILGCKPEASAGPGSISSSYCHCCCHPALLLLRLLPGQAA